MRNKLLVSVIVLAYNRKEYLRMALESTLWQTVERGKYEIILIKNFQDEFIDDFCLRNSVKVFTMEGIIGEYIAKGIRESRGEIIAFLEDDDIFVENKLQRLIELKEETNFDFIHNNYVEIDENGTLRSPYMRKLHLTSYNFDKVLYKSELTLSQIRDLQKKEADFNPSCMSISSRLGFNFVEALEKITACQDGCLFLAGLEMSGIVASGEVLTKYRVHNSTTNQFMSYREYANSIRKESQAQLKSIEKFRPCLKRASSLTVLNEMSALRMIKINTFNDKNSYIISRKYIELLRPLIHFQLSYIAWVMFFFASILFKEPTSKFIYKFVSSIQNAK